MNYKSKLNETVEAAVKRLVVPTIFSNSATNPIIAAQVAIIWQRLIQFNIDLLANLLDLSSDDQLRTALVQTLFEEFGDGDHTKIHTSLFKSLIAEMEIETLPPEIAARLIANSEQAMNNLRTHITLNSRDDALAGVFLGMELFAEQNLSFVKSTLLGGSQSKSELRQHPYFSVHDLVEPEHLARAINIAARLAEDADCFPDSVIISLIATEKFWKDFWGSMNTEV